MKVETSVDLFSKSWLALFVAEYNTELSIFLPLLNSLHRVPQKGRHHNHGDVLCHILTDFQNSFTG